MKSIYDMYLQISSRRPFGKPRGVNKLCVGVAWYQKFDKVYQASLLDPSWLCNGVHSSGVAWQKSWRPIRLMREFVLFDISWPCGTAAPVTTLLPRHWRHLKIARVLQAKLNKTVLSTTQECLLARLSSLDGGSRLRQKSEIIRLAYHRFRRGLNRVSSSNIYQKSCCVHNAIRKYSNTEKIKMPDVKKENSKAANPKDQPLDWYYQLKNLTKKIKCESRQRSFMIQASCKNFTICAIANKR